MSEAIPGKTYEHRKGGGYRVIALAEHTETCEAMVVYQRLADQEVFVRPKTLFEDGRFTASRSASPTRPDLEAGVVSGMKAENDRLRDQVEQLSRYLHACRERGGVQDSVAPERVADVIAQNLADEVARGRRLAAGRHKALDASDRFKDALRAVETAGPGLDAEALRKIAASALLEPERAARTESLALAEHTQTMKIEPISGWEWRVCVSIPADLATEVQDAFDPEDDVHASYAITGFADPDLHPTMESVGEALREQYGDKLIRVESIVACLESEVYELPDGSVTADSVDAAEQWAARARNLKNALSGAFGFIVSVRDAEGSGSFADAARSFIVRHRDLLMRSGSGDVADEKILPSLPGGDDDG